MTALDNIITAMQDQRLRDKVVAGAAWNKVTDPENWALLHLKPVLSDTLGQSNKTLADLHVEAAAAAMAAYNQIMTDSQIQAAVLQRQDYLASNG